MRQEVGEKNWERETGHMPHQSIWVMQAFGDGEWEATKGVTHKVSVLLLREFILTAVCGWQGTDRFSNEGHNPWQLS